MFNRPSEGRAGLTMTPRSRHEDETQAAIAEWLNVVLPLKEIVHIPNEARRSPAEAARQKRLGLRPGASDLIVFLPGRVVAIEASVRRIRQPSAAPERRPSRNSNLGAT